MTSSGDVGAGGPLIAGTALSGGEFSEYSDDELGASHFFDFSISPDTLQSRDVISCSAPKSLNPQYLTASGPFPDSPTGSYRDSSSESASSKRTPSSDSSKTPVATRGASMDGSADFKMDWDDANLSGFPDDDSTFPLGREADPSVMEGLFPFGEPDEGFMNRSFDFESASSSPDALLGGQSAVAASPVMPSTNSVSSQKPASQGNATKKPKAAAHRKRMSQYSASSAGIKKSTSREVSPMSTMVTSHTASPVASFFGSPSPLATQANGNAVWPNRLDVAVATAPDVLPTAAKVSHQAAQQRAAAQQRMAMDNHPAGYNFAGGYELCILPTPGKSRVETQIPIKIRLTPLPPGITKLHLPAHTISKPKLLVRPVPEPSPDTLELHVNLVCTSAMENRESRKKAFERAASVPQGYLPELDDESNTPQSGGDVRICTGCITRERKRAARKKVKKPEEEKIWSQDEQRRVIVFNTHELKDWQSLSGILDSNGRPEPGISPGAMQVDAPMRIACYCRHHGEKMGFNVIFTIKDFQGRVIAQAMSNPIMITDDHKTHPMGPQISSSHQPSEAVTSTTTPTHLPQSVESKSTPQEHRQASGRAVHRSNSEGSVGRGEPSPGSGKTTPTVANSVIPGRSLSRPSSPHQGGPVKKRKSSSSKVPNGLAMTRLDTSPSPGSFPASTQISAATSPFSSNASPFQLQQQQPEQLFGSISGQQAFGNGPPTPGSADQIPIFSHRSASMENLAMAQLYSAPTSRHPSRAPSPTSMRNSVANGMPNQFPQNLAAQLYTVPLGINQTRAPPVIHKIIPNEGPKMGGIEVTVLGAAFFQGLEVWFGDQKATTTTYWGDSSLVCLLPPSHVAGTVAVTFKQPGIPGPQAFAMGKQPTSFKYVDDNEDKLIRSALTIVGHKMSGQMLDVSELARRILGDSWASGSSGGASGPLSGAPMYNQSANSPEHLEPQLLKCLDLIDLDDSTHKTRLDFKRTTGHTMLHLACSLGYHRFVAALLARGANPDARDKGGFTPLHMAAIQNHTEIVRRLIIVGADPTIRSLSGLTPADVARSRAVLRAVRHSERHARSRSGGSIHSRTSSAASLRSLWRPLTRANTHEEPVSVDWDEESPEYTSGDFEDEDGDSDEEASLTMRLQRGCSSATMSEDEASEASDEIAAGSSTAAMAGALKDQLQQQFQQLQHSLAIQLQNLGNLPYLPAIPGLALPLDYQAYLHRMQQFVPGMSGPRPGPAGLSEESGSKVDGRWWGLGSSVNNNSSALPPAYEDIFPQGGKDSKQDVKQASAIRAAAEAEADVKCATLYDESPLAMKTRLAGKSTVEKPVSEETLAKELASEETAVEEPAPEETGAEELAPEESGPKVLKIGRKNAITRAQQEQFLRAREIKLKSLRSDRNLFFIWIPLLLVMICAMLCSYFPSLFPFVWTSVRALVQAGHSRVSRVLTAVPGRAMEV
ncbi:ankyrin repeat protein [Moelleriella libera RCEF 2490]|uniref:Ankyrin repeat protein n=1 Tax=Moelleriella libera RCEF 2490 TaxID=1081109 RepID=A0A167YL81_9HYPO|nr:ankyrin repeat protein [Moelleriella libera RCEF 2490]